MSKFAVKHPYWFQILMSAAVGAIGTVIYLLLFQYYSDLPVRIVFAGLLAGAFGGLLVVLPVVITIYECLLLTQVSGRTFGTTDCIYDFVILWMFILYEIMYLAAAKNVVFNADWQQTLENESVHTPLFTGSLPTIWVIICLALAGMLILGLVPLKKLPPLAAVLSISAMYLGTLLSIVWTIHIFQYEWVSDLLLLLLPVNCATITARMVFVKMKEYEPDENRRSKIDSVPFLGKCNRLLENAHLWPVTALLLMWPLLGILIVILILFGQAPDSVIKAWTETSQFNLSQKVSPQNIYYDEHYLCTVAAGGHQKVVRPKRKGIRHGHEVIVNRQLCIANAFEQVLEERTPHFHRKVRTFYDTYGFPVAKLIHSKYIADLIYYFMKPLEWVFLIVLYLTDLHPEDRIALQYTGKNLEDF